jgi:NAD(P)-dependent dehydrogenase (short-subunit alcohol dehydrogenase family)
MAPATVASAYSTSKAALFGLTKALARDLGPRGITANIVHPGSTDTDMNPANGPHAEHQRRKMATPRFGRGRGDRGNGGLAGEPAGPFRHGSLVDHRWRRQRLIVFPRLGGRVRPGANRCSGPHNDVKLFCNTAAKIYGSLTKSV